MERRTLENLHNNYLCENHSISLLITQLVVTFHDAYVFQWIWLPFSKIIAK